MPQTPAWHLADQPVYHDNTECFYDGAAPPETRQAGNGGKPLCHLCERLDRAEDELWQRPHGEHGGSPR